MKSFFWNLSLVSLLHGLAIAYAKPDAPDGKIGEMDSSAAMLFNILTSTNHIMVGDMRDNIAYQMVSLLVFVVALARGLACLYNASLSSLS